jgi:DNA-binding NarL/FixJ family response regulator
MPKYKIFIVDDHEIFRDGLKSLINNEEIGIVIGEAGNGQQFLDLLEKITPDLVLMDIDMPIMNGLEATKIAMEKRPNLKILALTMYGDENYYYRMIDAGVKGFLLKTSGMVVFEKAISSVASGQIFFSNEILHNIISSFSKKTAEQKLESLEVKLSAREIDVLKLICKGLTNENIGEELHISPQTVKGHRAMLLEKTKSKNTASLVIYAIKHKIIEI